MNTAPTVMHVFGPLHRSGAEVMLLSALRRFPACATRHSVLSLANEADSTNADAFRQLGVKTFHAGAPSHAARVRAMLRSIRAIRPDVVHVHTEGSSTALIIAARVARRPTVRTIHSSFGFSGLLRRRRVLERFMVRVFGARQVSISPTVHDNERLRFRNPTRRILNWYDDELFSPPTDAERAQARNDLEIPSGRTVAVVVGNCSEVKNHRLLLNALALVDDEHRPFLLHVGRERPERDERELVSYLGLDRDVRFLGSRDDVHSVFHAVDLYVMPSTYEGIGIAALEASGTGLPLVVSDAPGTRDLSMLGDHVAVARLEAAAFASVLSALGATPATDPARALAAARTHRLFGLERGVREYLDLYIELANVGA